MKGVRAGSGHRLSPNPTSGVGGLARCLERQGLFRLRPRSSPPSLLGAGAGGDRPSPRAPSAGCNLWRASPAATELANPADTSPRVPGLQVALRSADAGTAAGRHRPVAPPLLAVRRRRGRGRPCGGVRDQKGVPRAPDHGSCPSSPQPRRYPGTPKHSGSAYRGEAGRW